MARLHWKPWITQPLWHALIGWFLTLLFVYFASGPGPSHDYIAYFALFILLLAFIAQIVTIIVSVTTYPTTSRFLRRLVLMYIAMILGFAQLYFIMLLFPIKSPFDGIHSPWVWISDYQGRRLNLGDAAMSIIDCVHFSCVTITTVGYGDMRPVHWSAKLAVDAEILLGLSLVVIGVGRYFSRKDAKT
jgi:hypothetical protein